MRVSQSKIKTWRRCRRAAHYKYIELLRRRVPPRPLKFGSLVHRMLEHEKNGRSHEAALEELTPQDWQMFEEQIEEYGDIAQDALDIMSSYKRYWKKDRILYIPVGKEKRRAEHELFMDIAPGITAIVIIDFLARSDNGKRWLGDHKTYSRELSDDALWKSMQAMLYHRVWEENGHKPLDGTLWDMVWSKAPGVPKITKTGKVSESACVTLPETLKRFFVDNDIDPKEHKERWENAKSTRSRYFRRVYMPRHPTIEKSMFTDFKRTAKEINRKLGKDRTRNIDKHCDWCEFRLLCQARLLNLDYGFVKRNHYIVDEGRADERITTGD